MQAPDVIVVGIGNPDRGDDAAGSAVVQRLRGAFGRDIELAEENGETAALLARIERADAAYLVDACASGAPAGTIRRFDAAAAPLPHHTFALSTHGLGLAEAIELARALGQLPSCCIVYAIEGASFEAGVPLTPAVADAVADVAARLQAEIRSTRALG
jgi:hydrogenase maturation protease